MPDTTSSLLRRFSEIVARYPNQVAVIGTNISYTFEDLDAHSNRLAERLKAMHLPAHSPIALLLARSPAAIVSMLGVLKAGFFYVPLDTSYPPLVVEGYLKQLHAHVAIVCSSVRSAAHCLGIRFLTISSCGEIIADSLLAESVCARSASIVSVPSKLDALTVVNNAAGTLAIADDDPAYAMFTSGSTGEPKGVLVPHRAIQRLVVDTNYIEITSHDRVLHAAPITFDASTFEIWGALLNGATLVVYESDALDLAAMHRLVERERATIMWLTASLFHLVVRNSISMLTGLRVLLAGGDVLHCDAMRLHMLSTLSPALRSLMDMARRRTLRLPAVTSCTAIVHRRTQCPSESRSLEPRYTFMDKTGTS